MVRTRSFFLSARAEWGRSTGRGDTRLGRDVAIKVLPESVAGDRERLARFEREAKLLASLNHPHIAAIHGVEGSGLTSAPQRFDAAGLRLIGEAMPLADHADVIVGVYHGIFTASETGALVYRVGTSSGATRELLWYDQKNADGTGSTSPLFVDNAAESVPSFSWDGRYLICQRRSGPASHSETWALPLSGQRKPFPVVRDERFDGADPALSPDSRWLAYVSTESGRQEDYVVPFGQGSGKWQVSIAGGSWPLWRRNGKEIFYLSPENKVMSAEVSGEGGSFAIGKVGPLFQANPASGPGWKYEVNADGTRFIVVTEGAGKTAAAPLTLVVHWPALPGQR